MVALGNTALNLSRLAGHANFAEAQRQASWRPSNALQAIHTA